MVMTQGDDEILKGWSAQWLAAWLERQPEEFRSELRRISAALGPEVAVEHIKAFRRVAADPAAPQQERDEAVWLLKHTGFDDESLKKQDD
jgi:hypothetical protein